MKLKIIYRKNLKMSPGKIAAQAVHAAVGVKHDDNSLSVVALGVSDNKFFEKLREIESCKAFYYLVKDAGYTEVEKGTMTCLAFYENENGQPG